MINLLPRTHRFIGKLIFTVVHKGLHVKLKKIALEYGSIKPDMLPVLKSIPHTKDHSFHFVKELIYNIIDKPMPLKKRELREFSVQLGVLLHFISDYFCHVHNNESFDSLRKHYLYERKLGKRFVKSKWTKTYASSIPYECSLASAGELIDYIEGKHNAYMLTPQQISADIHFCLEVCMRVAVSIVANRFISIASNRQETLVG